MSQASENGRPAASYRTARNGLTLAYRAVYPLGGTAFAAPFNIKAGSPVSALAGNSNVDGCSVVPPFAGGGLRGVLTCDLVYGKNGQQASNMVKEGLINANVYIPTASAAVKGASLVPVFGADADGYSYFVVTNHGTSPFRLLEALTAEEDGTFLKVDVDGGALVEIAPGIDNFAWWDAPVTADADYFYTGTDAAADASVTLLEEFPDVPRNLRTVSDGATTAAFNMTATGYNVAGEEITEVISVSTTNGTVTQGNQVFARVTNIAIAAPDASTAWEAGFADKLQLPRTASGTPIVLGAKADSTLEGTAPTLAADPDEISKNTIDFNTASDGSKVFSARLMY